MGIMICVYFYENIDQIYRIVSVYFHRKSIVFLLRAFCGDFLIGMFGSNDRRFKKNSFSRELKPLLKILTPSVCGDQNLEHFGSNSKLILLFLTKENESL